MVAYILKPVKLQIWNRKSVKTCSRSNQLVMTLLFTIFSYCLRFLAVIEAKIFMIYVNVGQILVKELSNGHGPHCSQIFIRI